MYRDGLVERRQRAALRLADVIDTGTRALALRYGAVARGALSSALDGARAAAEGELGVLEHALDVAEACVSACAFEHARIGDEAATYVNIGVPASSAFIATGLGFPDPPEWRRAVAKVVGKRLRELALTCEVIAAPRAKGIAIFFVEGGHPFLVDIEADQFEDGDGYFTKVLLVGHARATLSSIEVRPQTFGDDLFAMLRIRRDRNFGDDAFDPLYFVEGTAAALEDFFTAGVRAAFVMIARREPVVAEIANAIVTIELKTQPLREACALIAALR